MEVAIKLDATECVVCGIPFALPEHMLNDKREKGGFIHCPNGHSVGWGEGKIEKELKLTKANLQGYVKRCESLSSEVNSLEASNRGLKAANTRLKKKK
jgi:hypothetical protein